MLAPVLAWLLEQLFYSMKQKLGIFLISWLLEFLIIGSCNEAFDLEKLLQREASVFAAEAVGAFPNTMAEQDISGYFINSVRIYPNYLCIQAVGFDHSCGSDASFGISWIL